MLKPGLYEQVVTDGIESELEEVPEECKDVGKIDAAEASKVLSAYVSEVVRQRMDQIFDADSRKSLEKQIEIANRIIREVGGPDGSSEQAVHGEGAQLLTLREEDSPDAIFKKDIRKTPRPETSMAFSSLFTGAVREPQMLTELKKEILSADRIDMLVSFIKWSGLRMMIEELRSFTASGGTLRVICTSYMGATDVKAVEELNKLPNTSIRISYDTRRTRLHAKSYVFYRDTGFTTAYIGSSNMSNAALTSGLEWNVKVTEKDMGDTIDKVAATFESYWNDPEFTLYDSGQRDRLTRALESERYTGEERKFVFDIRPYSYQQEILDRLEAERRVRGQNKNLVVAATGCGKTVISAFDYRRFCSEHPSEPNRLLFVAHREEILKQSIETFRGVLKDPNFGDLMVGNHQPQTPEHLFVSIQSVNSRRLYERLPKDYYSFIIVDEFHHAAAPVYQHLLKHFEPQILLGLTATPERMDGENILDYFDGRIAAEIRLPEAIDRKLLCPFQYFGVTDTVDLSEIRWTRGGYDRKELSNVLSMNTEVAKRRADNVVENIYKYVTSVDKMKALGFCVSVEHAKFMSDFFNEAGIPAMHLEAGTRDEIRGEAKKKLERGEVKVIFVVDLYNEGVDIPSVNTVLFLRPTESLTVFLQQLGRGLRLDEGKECLTVLDFVGRANSKYNYEEKFAALLSNTKHSVESELKRGFVSVPKGCYIQLEKKASEYILKNIRNSIETRRGLISKIGTFSEDTGRPLSLNNFLEYYHLDPRTVYQRGSFSELSYEAGVREDFGRSEGGVVERAFPKLAAIDSRRLLNFLIARLPKMQSTRWPDLTAGEQRMMQMFYVTVWQEPIDSADPEPQLDKVRRLTRSGALFEELMSLLQYQYSHIDFVDQALDFGFDCPLDAHCTYTRDQILVALDFMKPNTIREGVKWLPEKKLDLLFVTLNKSDKDYSPTTMYKDYAISDLLFHWQSQSTTGENSSAGLRYQHHREMGSKVLLCVRESKHDRWNNTGCYTILGFADYVSHTGSKPMNITWRLEQPIPAKYLKETKKLIVG